MHLESITNKRLRKNLRRRLLLHILSKHFFKLLF
jgi:hypothetical protein